MNRLPLLLTSILALTAVQPILAESDPVQTAQSLFDIMSKHDGEGGKALFAAEATMTSVHDDGTATVVTAEKFLSRIGSAKDDLLERMWNPQVLQHGSIAVVWANYDFHINGKFHHCGVDSFNLLKTGTGWKIASVAYTSETSDCPPSPLGEPQPKEH